MGSSKIIDAFVAYQFIKLLSTPWDETDAFKLGIIDASGKILKIKRIENKRRKSRIYNHP